MARPVFSVSIPAGATSQDLPGGSPVSEVPRTIRFASELPEGVPKRRKPKGFTAPTAYSLSRDVSDLGHGELKFDVFSRFTGKYIQSFRSYGNNNAIRYGYPYPSNSIGNAYGGTAELNVEQAMIDKALIKARLGMKRSDINLGVAFAERSQTARLVGDTAISLARAYRSLRRGHWQQAWRDLGLKPARKAPRGSSAPAKWLEYQYGWKPLLSDVHGAVDALSRRDKGDWRITSKGSERIDLSREVLMRQNSIGAHVLTSKGWKGAMVRIDAVPVNDLVVMLSQLGILNPLLVAWELVPYSFVVDWFLPIGSYLESLDAMLGYGPTYCSISTFSKVKVSGRGSSFVETDDFYRRVGGWQGEWTVERLRLNRTISTSVPLPTLPRIKDGASLAHMANGLSLLASAFGRR